MIHKFTVKITTNDHWEDVDYVLSAQLDGLTNEDDKRYENVYVDYEGTEG